MLSSMVDVLKSMTPQEFAEYAPIAGTPEYLDVIKDVVFGDYIPQGSIEACATPGGTGSIRNVISNYSRPGDKILTSNWHWSPYQVIASEIGRSVETYQMFDEKNDFNLASFREHIQSVLTEQDSIVILFTAP